MNAQPATALDRVLFERDISSVTVALTCGVTQQCVSAWRLGRRRPGVQHAKLLDSALGIPRHLIRPDLFDAPTPKAASKGRAAPKPPPADRKTAIVVSKPAPDPPPRRRGRPRAASSPARGERSAAIATLL
jgi:hypothetical protein